MRKGKTLILGLLAVLVLPFGISLAEDPPGEKGKERYTWRNAPRHSSGVAPDADANRDQAIVMVMAADTFGWRGYFAVHPWIIYKRAGESSYTRYDVVGWGQRQCRAPELRDPGWSLVWIGTQTFGSPSRGGRGKTDPRD